MDDLTVLHLHHVDTHYTLSCTRAVDEVGAADPRVILEVHDVIVDPRSPGGNIVGGDIAILSTDVPPTYSLPVSGYSDCASTAGAASVLTSVSTL